MGQRLTELAVLVTEVTLLVTIDITGPIDLRKGFLGNYPRGRKYCILQEKNKNVIVSERS